MEDARKFCNSRLLCPTSYVTRDIARHRPEATGTDTNIQIEKGTSQNEWKTHFSFDNILSLCWVSWPPSQIGFNRTSKILAKPVSTGPPPPNHSDTIVAWFLKTMNRAVANSPLQCIVFHSIHAVLMLNYCNLMVVKILRILRHPTDPQMAHWVMRIWGFWGYCGVPQMAQGDFPIQTALSTFSLYHNF